MAENEQAAAARAAVLAEVEAEMGRTDENVEGPTFADYAADVERRLDFIVRGGRFRPGNGPTHAAEAAVWTEYRVVWQDEPLHRFPSREDADRYVWGGVVAGNERSDYRIEGRTVSRTVSAWVVQPPQPD